MAETYSKTFTGKLTDASGNTRHFINGAYGRESDLPCLENADGALHWYVENPKRGSGFGARNELPHRIGGPAIIRADGSTYWLNMGKYHRGGDLPAIELEDGAKKWFVDGIFVRIELPAPAPLKSDEDADVVCNVEVVETINCVGGPA